MTLARTLHSQLVSGLLFPLQERLKRHTTTTLLGQLEHSQWLGLGAIRALQGERLHAFMTHLATSVPFYRGWLDEHGLTPADFRDPGALARLPVTDKPFMRAHFEALRSEHAHDLIGARTSGSSGEPLHFLLSRPRISFDIAAKWRATRWWDVDIGDPELVLWGATQENSAQDRVREWRDRLFATRLIPTGELTDARLDQILGIMRQTRPKQLFGYPSALARLAFRAIERGLPMNDLGIRVAFCTSEVLRPEWRQAIASAFGCGVANEYGARDAGFIARECPQGGLHITAEELIVEVVDSTGEPLPPGEEGDILVTNLAGPEFPFLRYRTGDRGALSPLQCPCGRGLPLLQQLSGRANDGLRSTRGGWVHGSAINHLMRDLPGLRAYQVVQHEPDRVSIAIVTDTPPDPAHTDALEHRLRTLLGDEVRCEVQRTSHIPPAANGKFRHIICTLPPPGMPAAPNPRS